MTLMKRMRINPPHRLKVPAQIGLIVILGSILLIG
jgi:hypothetical protein